MDEARPGRLRRVAWGITFGATLVAVGVSAVLALVHAVRPLLPTTSDPLPSAAATGPAAPSSSPSAAGSATTDDLRLPGAGADVVYVQAAAAIYRVDLRSGRLTRTATPELTQFSSLVAGPGWIVSKTVDFDTGVVVRDGRPAVPLPDGLRENGRLYPAGGDRVWFVPEEASGAYRTAVELDLDGHRVHDAAVRIPDEFGIPTGDGAGRLLVTNVSGAYQARPDGLHRLAAGQVLALGPRHVLTWSCDDRGRCNTYRTDRTTHRASLLAANRQAVLELYQGDQSSASSYQGTLSPQGAHAALGLPPRGSNLYPLAVLDLRTGRHQLLPGTLTDTNPNAQVVWTANGRWLLALTDGRLRAYDTVTRTVRTLRTGGEPLQHLVSSSTVGF